MRAAFTLKTNFPYWAKMAEYFEKGFSTVTGDGTVATPAYT